MKFTEEMINEDEKRWHERDVVTELGYCGNCMRDRKDMKNIDIRFYAYIMRKAHDMLKEQEARVMTLDEIRKADYVWLEVDWPYTKDHKPYLNIALPVPYEDWNYEDMILFRVKADIDQADHDYSVHYFGTVWRCWTAKPTPEQMSGTEWETKI